MKALIAKGGKAQNFDPVPEITRKHFEEGLRGARRSVTQMDLQKFEQFRRKFDPSFVSKNPNSGGTQIKWPSSSAQHRRAEQEDDLYS